jgi:hypothetical protein
MGNIKWIKLGDENSKLFHANATLRHRRNSIPSLVDSAGEVISDHAAKANLIWNDFKERLGTTCAGQMLFDLDSILMNNVDLSSLEMPFSNAEIDNVIKCLPSDKSPGLDGFNNEFLKKCWHIIKDDFYDLCEAFFAEDVCLRRINGSFITLIPKVDNLVRINDYRHISLLNSSVKIITKLLANRLQPLITKLIHQNQYGFIKSRSIQDCLA